MEYKILILLHLLSACIWVGGHIVLSLGILPKAWKNKNVEIISNFENSFEKIGIPALIIQVLTGLRLSSLYVPISNWFNFSDRLSAHISFKLILLFLTVILAIHARFYIIPKLNEDRIPALGMHIIGVTIISILFLIVGLSFRLSIIL